MPDWLDDARLYTSMIGEEPTEPVSVLKSDVGEGVSSDSPGMLCLRLEPRSRFSPRVRVFDAGGCEEGVIRSEGIVPGVRYVMRRDGDPVWTLSVQSIVRKRHSLVMANGDGWLFETPFFWWQHLTGTSRGATRLLGGIGPSWTIWLVWIEPGRDTRDILAAIAFLHRQWCRW